jgi:hypothetical protein
MSSHFNYEINESRMRNRLKNMSLPVEESDWKRFAEYAQNHPLNSRRSSLPAFQININRTLLLPLAFGLIIIAFSFLLFNFVNIKKKPEIITENVTPPNKENKEIPVQKPAVLIEDSLIKDTSTLPLVSSEPAKEIAATETKPVETATSGAVTADAKTSHTAVVAGDIYELPNKASTVIGSFETGKKFTAIEETVYFIRVLQARTTGYVLKSQLNQSQTAPLRSSGKFRKAEVLQPNNTTFRIYDEEKEQELK